MGEATAQRLKFLPRSKATREKPALRRAVASLAEVKPFARVVSLSLAFYFWSIATLETLSFLFGEQRRQTEKINVSLKHF